LAIQCQITSAFFTVNACLYVDLCANKPEGRRKTTAWDCRGAVRFLSPQTMGRSKRGILFHSSNMSKFLIRDKPENVGPIAQLFLQDLPSKPKYLVTFTVGYAQKANIDAAVKKVKKRN
jgi:hypothetical protein